MDYNVRHKFFFEQDTYSADIDGSSVTKPGANVGDKVGDKLGEYAEQRR